MNVQYVINQGNLFLLDFFSFFWVTKAFVHSRQPKKACDTDTKKRKGSI